MVPPHPFSTVASGEEFVAAACAAVAHYVPDAEDELTRLSQEHVQAARMLAARPRRWLKLRVTLRATLAAAVGTGLGALTWLRTQEQRLVDAYVALEQVRTLGVSDRQRLRRELVPSAFERFSRVDRIIQSREEEGAFA